MLQIERVKLELEEDESLLRRRAAAALRIPEAEVLEVRVLHRAIDAREGVRFIYTLRAAVKNEKNVLKRCKNKNVAPVSETPYRLPDPVDPPEVPPVVVGAGPGGLFCALALARCGARPILLERGRNVERRTEDVERFWETGTLDPESNVQFGEGGAGAFSDGKLNTGTRDMRHRFILETLTAHGAPESQVLLGELNPAAVRICRQNIRRCGLAGRAAVMRLDVLQPPPRSMGAFACVVSNPPYIPDGDIPGLDRSVRDFEPHLALAGGADGCDFYRAIVRQWRDVLAPGGRLFFEVGIGQADTVADLMAAGGFADIQVVPDSQDIPRVVYGTR